MHADGLRFRVDHRVVGGSVTVRPDVVFTRARVALFIDGCFWHACLIHGNEPLRNQSYWTPKLRRNVERDRYVKEAPEHDGWFVIRAWSTSRPTQWLIALSSGAKARTALTIEAGRTTQEYDG